MLRVFESFKLYWVVALALGLAACPANDKLVANTGGLMFRLPDSSPSVDQVLLYIQNGDVSSLVREGKVEVLNFGNRAIQISWGELKEPLRATLPKSIPPGATTLTFYIDPGSNREVEDQVTVTGPGGLSAILNVSGKSAYVEKCVPPNDCVVTKYDERHACVFEKRADGVACSTGTLCSIGGKCSDGQCVGESLNCDDKNKCTLKACQPLVGCEILPAPPCPGDGKCKMGVCDPKTGCSMVPVVDGTRCGPADSCSEVDICIAGNCVKRAPPEGYACAEESPCRTAGKCTAGTCSFADSTITPLNPTWSYDSLLENPPGTGAGTTTRRLGHHDFVLEQSGEGTVLSWFAARPVLRANTTPVPMVGSVRRCIIWNARLVCADYPPPDGTVSAVDLVTGETHWTYDIYDQPNFPVETAANLYLARIVVQAPDRLAAIYEGYPRGTDGKVKGADARGSTQCRIYYLSVIDATGKPISLSRIDDPMLNECNHPHPYGVSTDVVGNLYITFSPTLSLYAPLLPSPKMLTISYTRDGVLRWKNFNPSLRGGELAIARSLLYLENSREVLDARSGEVVSNLPRPVGRAVIANNLVIPAPENSGTELRGYQAGTNTERWTNTLPPTEMYWGEQIRLATWKTSLGPRTVALAFTVPKSETAGNKLVSLAPSVTLQAIDVENGLTAFRCPINLKTTRTEVQLFEISDEGMMLMNGAVARGIDSLEPGCLKCDPPLAGSNAAFSFYKLKGITPSKERWIGTFGGAGHDGNEKQ